VSWLHEYDDGLAALREASRPVDCLLADVSDPGKGESNPGKIESCPGVFPENESGRLVLESCGPVGGLEGTMNHMAGRKRHSAEDIVRKLRRADELAAAGKTGEEIAAELEVSPATLYNWRRTYGGMDTDAAKELKELREQNARLKRLLAEAELEKDALREVAKGKF
jgi:putative transposase